jgi:sensor histidine kinase YesM
LGLANVKRRLELLYGKNFSLVTSSNENEFKVNLSLPL